MWSAVVLVAGASVLLSGCIQIVTPSPSVPPPEPAPTVAAELEPAVSEGDLDACDGVQAFVEGQLTPLEGASTDTKANALAAVALGFGKRQAMADDVGLSTALYASAGIVAAASDEIRANGGLSATTAVDVAGALQSVYDACLALDAN